MSGAGPVAIAGGGAVGLCVAYHLARLGEEVVVFERGPVGEGCSAGNAGWICPAHGAPLPKPGMPALGVRSLVTPQSPLTLRPWR